MSLQADWVIGDEPVLCYQEGFRAFVKRVGKRFENPYHAGSKAHRAFQAGWLFALRSFPVPAASAPAGRKAGRATKAVRPPLPLPVLRTH